MRIRSLVHPVSSFARSDTRRALSLCKLCDVLDWEDPAFRMLASEIMGGEPGYSPQHRKLWEFVQVVRALARHELLSESARGLSVAAGYERLLYFLSNRVRHLVATDIYGEGAFMDREATAEVLVDPVRYAPYPYRESALSFLYMNALNLSFPDATFDFAFCLSSLEHFGGLTPAVLAVKEMARVVRPGGLVMFSTECSLNGFCTDEVFSPSEIEEMVRQAGLRLVQPLEWNISEASRELCLDMRRDDLQSLPHVNLKLLSSIFTSVSVAAAKPGELDSRVSDEEFHARMEVARRTLRSPVVQPHRSLVNKVTSKVRRAKWHLEEFLFVR